MKTSPTPLARSFTARRAKPATLRAVSLALIFGGLMMFSLSHQAVGQGLVPERLSFQGYMEDGAGAPLGSTTPTNYPVVFRIFPTASAGTASWSERQTVTFDKGNYSVILGQGSPNGLEPHPILSTVVATAVGSLLYVETTVTVNGNDVKIQPRMQLLPTPYSFLATRSVTAATADTAVSVPGSAIQAGTITQDRLGEGVLSNIFQAPIADSRLSANITQGPIDDSRLSTNITHGPIDESRLPQGGIADNRLSTNVAFQNTANTFAGNQTINGNAVVNGNVTITNNLNLGTAGQFKVVVGDEDLRVVRGQITVRGPIQATFPEVRSGSGFSVRKNTTYFPVNTQYGGTIYAFAEIIFDPPFADPPTVTVSLARDTASTAINWYHWLTVEVTTRTNVIVSAYHADNGGYLLLTPFNFIAVGAR